MKLILSLLFLCSWALANNMTKAPQTTGELIVKLKDGATLSRGGISAMNLGVDVLRTISVSNGQFVVVKPEQGSFYATQNSIANHPMVEYVEPNYIYHAIGQVESAGLLKRILSKINSPLEAPKDAMFNKLWGLSNTGNNDPKGLTGVKGVDIDALKAWKLTKGKKEIKIAVIDTGVDYNHPDLKANMWVNEKEANGQKGVDDDGNGYVDDIHGYNFTTNRTPDNPIDGHGHGTHCAGTIGAVHNDIGVAGVMANVSIVAIKFLTDQGSGTTEDAIKSVDYATKLGVDIMSNSWGGGGASRALQEAIERARDKGILFVAAAGNSGTNNDQSPHYPSNYDVDNVIAVAAHNASGNLATFTCYGKETVDIAAPGRNILSTVTNGAYDVYSGTSMATPHVSGVLGLFLSHNEENLNFSELRERIVKTSIPADMYNGKMVSEGRISAYNLLKNIKPVRYIPNPDTWEMQSLQEPFDVLAYKDNQENSAEVNFDKEVYVRVVIKDFETEKGYDFLTIKSGNGKVVDKISGKIDDYKSAYVKTKKLILNFKSDFSNTAAGFRIDEIEVNSKSVIKE